MLPAKDVLRLVSGALQDLEPGMAKRWPWTGGQDDSLGLLDLLNAAMRAVAAQRPDCCSITEVIALVPGMRQHIPKAGVLGASRDAVLLCELVRNMGSDGKTPGNPVFSVRQDILMSWARSTKPAASPEELAVHHWGSLAEYQVQNYACDRATNPAIYYVYPAVPENRDVKVEVTYYATPRAVSDAEAMLEIADGYTQALAHHMLASIFAADNEQSLVAKAEFQMKLFQNHMAVKAQADAVWPRAKSSIGIMEVAS